MSGSPAYASAEVPSRILVCGVNWLGDAVMTMPAMQAFRERHPGAELSLLVKKPLRALWELHDAPSRIRTIDGGFTGTWQAGVELRGAGCELACVFPNSFRSALIPRIARIPRRRGTARGRRLLINDAVNLDDYGDRHQAYEYFHLLGLPEPDRLPAPRLSLKEAQRDRARSLLGRHPAPYVALLPGAARGPSKQWPTRHWLDLASRIVRNTSASLVCLGTESERSLCDQVAYHHPERTINLAGTTGLGEFAAVLKHCAVAVSNDSGGMHIAAAVGIPVVALFGITDPAKTGPLGERAVVLQHSQVRRRDVPRDSAEARAAMAAIQTDEVFMQVQERLAS